jgi:TonB dependent receptor
VPNPFYGIIQTGALSSPTVARRQLLLPYPQYTTVSQQFPNAIGASYHGLILKAERRVGNGLTFLGSYVWSKQIDQGSEPVGGAAVLNVYDLEAERGLSVYDTPHNLVASAVYDLPFGRERRFASQLPAIADALLGGWTVSAIARWQSGVPIMIGRPAVRDDRDASLDDPTIERWFDTSVFSPAQPFTFGNVGRTLSDVRADGVKNVDMTVSKNVAVARYRLQLRADVFNLFNRTQFGAPNGSVTNAAFGTVTTQANSPREIQLGVKFYW